MSGLVEVTLALSPDHNAPIFGRSLCTFTYREEQESLSVNTSYELNTELTFGTAAFSCSAPYTVKDTSYHA